MLGAGQANSARSIERTRINFPWLVKLRWAAVVGQLATIAIAGGLLRAQVAPGPLLAIVVLETASNLALMAWFFRVRGPAAWPANAEIAERLEVAVLAMDSFFLTALLFFSGGPNNPFSLFYLAHLALAAAILRGPAVWALTGFACVGFAALFAGHVRVPELLADSPRELRMSGLLVAFSSAAAVVVYFIARVTGELAQADDELARAVQLRARSEKLEALGTLAAGAAHELSSPLSTIAVVAKELSVALAKGTIGPETLDDAELVRSEVDRCRTILRRMAADAGQVVGEAVQEVRGDELIAAVLDGVREPERIATDIGPGLDQIAALAPMHGLGQALRGLVHNALDASPPERSVTLFARREAGGMRLEIRDRGAGMLPEVLARVGEPFFTTKDVGKGMGLGVFLARSLVEKLGGTLRFEPGPEGGIVAIALLPASSGAEP